MAGAPASNPAGSAAAAISAGTEIGGTSCSIAASTAARLARRRPKASSGSAWRRTVANRPASQRRFWLSARRSESGISP